MDSHRFDVGLFVRGGPHTARALVRHSGLFQAFAAGTMIERDLIGESYLSVFAFGREMQTHVAQNRGSTAGFSGPCWARWLWFDLDRPDLDAALDDTRRLVGYLQQRYPEIEPLVWFSGSKGFHIGLELVHRPPPSVDFPCICRALAEAIAQRVKVQIDSAIYSATHILRLPNTRHPKTGLYKRRLDVETLLEISIEGVLQHAAHPAGDGLPNASATCPNLETDWADTIEAVRRQAKSRAAMRQNPTPDLRAPRDVIEFLRYGAPVGQRHKTLFRAAAWMREQGAPPSLIAALLTEPGLDSGLSPGDVARQIQCGIRHALAQRGSDVPPDPDDEIAGERWAIEHEHEALPLPSVGADGIPF